MGDDAQEATAMMGRMEVHEPQTPSWFHGAEVETPGVPRKRHQTTPAVSPSDPSAAALHLRKRHNHEKSPDPSALRSTQRAWSTGADAVSRNLLDVLDEEGDATLIVYQPSCLDHHTGRHQENRQRVAALCGPHGVLNLPRFQHLRWAPLDQLVPARLVDLERVHSRAYLRHLEATCALLPPQDANLSIQNEFEGHRSHKSWIQTTKAVKCHEDTICNAAVDLDPDMPISKESFMTARYAVGAVLHAVDEVVCGRSRNAFVVVRPPGHHAGPYGCVENDAFHKSPGGCSCGFCLLNNVAIGAAYAMTTYGPSHYSKASISHATVRRVAIIDFDIHHGNGTEEIVRNLRLHDHRYPLPPSWAPKTFPSYMPWRDDDDADNVFFASMHVYDETTAFYPGSGRGPHGRNELASCNTIVNIPLTNLGASGKRGTERTRLEHMERASSEFQSKATEVLLPALRAFAPDLILISSGFDGHVDDYYHGLTEWDYEWITQRLVEIADNCCDGRIVSVLEGGYSLAPPSKASSSNLALAADRHGRDVDPDLIKFGGMARSCAAHVAALSRD
ncbi:hypothetical protein SDRG_16829 [Saprolegnia diclina VS20]|uniref:Histone deacetylase domain-containing protein n=1 Tax=Saprolegnia diclina (strain VS20) TaxID=1156394 RepID=T0R736_SAPDV|nr:hypothetical protein SDRG_16829 [Saprolegnia diclina VS20]EQC25307.1 hypothetical protein SDRG_16829 [Saprolegnia diclina VS20]|eukprot:XP_008621273.1 hypothetical protein SDRG_16829 [Saprolegnia diclina VS20]